MNIPSLTPRDIIASLTTCTTLAYEGREYCLKSSKLTVIVAMFDKNISDKESSFDRDLAMLSIFAEWK